MHPLLFKGLATLLAIGYEPYTLWVNMLLSHKVVLLVLSHLLLYYGVVLYLFYVLFYAVSYYGLSYVPYSLCVLAYNLATGYFLQ